jgi:hypothetical protein
VRYTFIQLRAFTAEAARAGMSNDDIRAMENDIMQRPLAWPIMPGTGGLRKMRFAPESASRGKSGGVRVYYFLADGAGRVYLTNVFSKNEKANLTQAQKAIIKGMIDRIRANLKKELQP